MHKACKIVAKVLITVGFLGMASCETELHVIDQTYDLPVVWGLIDPVDSVYDIRIQKSFCGKGNAADMAKIYDSIYFDSLNVFMELRYAPDKNMVGIYAGQDWYGEWDMAGDLIHRVRLNRTQVNSKETGFFNYDPYRIYQTHSDEFRIRGKVYLTDPGYWTVPQGQGYFVRVTIENPKTGQTTVATTPFVDMPNILIPRKAFTLNLYDRENSKIIWQDHGWFYDSQIQFYYIEFTDHEEIKSVGWRITGINRTRVEIPVMEFYSYTATPFGENLLGHVGAEIKDSPDVIWRKFSHIDYSIVAAPEFVKEYLDSYFISADHAGQPTTNVTNGNGLFALIARNGRSGFHLDFNSRDSLSRGRFTKHLKFVKW